MNLKRRSDNKNIHRAFIFSDNRIIIHQLINALPPYINLRFNGSKWVINDYIEVKRGHIIVINKIENELKGTVILVHIYKNLSDLLRVYEIIGI